MSEKSNLGIYKGVTRYQEGILWKGRSIDILILILVVWVWDLKHCKPEFIKSSKEATESVKV